MFRNRTFVARPAFATAISIPANPGMLGRWLGRGAIGLALALGGLAAAGATTADDVAAKQHDADLAKAEADIAKSKADQFEAEQKLAAAKIGTIDTTGLPKGTGEATDLHVEGKIQAYRALDAIAQEIAKAVSETMKGETKIVMYDAQELGAVRQLQSFEAQLATVLEAVHKEPSLQDIGHPMLPPFAPAAAACPAATTTVTSKMLSLAPLAAVDIALKTLAIFKTDKKITGIDVTVDDFGLAAAVMQHLRMVAPAVQAIYPASHLEGLFASPAPSGELRIQLDKLTTAMAALDFVTGQIGPRRNAMKAQAAANAFAKCKGDYDAYMAELDRLEVSLKALKANTNLLWATVMKIDDKTGESTYGRFLDAERLVQAAKDAWVLQLQPVAAGGATMSKTNLFATNFYFSGGAVVAYLLADGSGKAKLSGVTTRYAGFVSADKFAKEEEGR